MFVCRNFGLLSFGEEAEEDETETNDFVQKNASKSKSVHDVIDDPKLSKETLNIEKKADDYIEERRIESDEEVTSKEKADRVREKLKKFGSTSESKRHDEKKKPEEEKPQSDSDSDDYGNALEKERRIKRQKKV